MSDIQIINPITYPGWDNLLLSTPGHSFFHSSAWARVLSETYGYTPFYFTMLKDHKLRALVPLMEIRSILTGKRGVSLPFTDCCEPIIDQNSNSQILLDHIIDYGQKRRWKYIQFRGDGNLFPDARPSETYLGHALDLTRGEEEIFARLRDSTRRNIKQSESRGVETTISNQAESIRDFQRLNSLTRKKHGLPPQPCSYFQKVYDHIISKGLGFVALAFHHGRSIAGSICFHFGDTGIFKYGASDMKFQDLRPNNRVVWDPIRWFCKNGFKSLSFGRTEPMNEGLKQFKSGWGADEHILSYFKYNLRKMEFASSQPKINDLSAKIFHMLPMPVLKLAGSILYRHVG